MDIKALYLSIFNQFIDRNVLTERRTTGFMNHAGLIEKCFRVDFREIITRVTFSISILNIT